MTYHIWNIWNLCFALLKKAIAFMRIVGVYAKNVLSIKNMH